jgi:hypothetical protein
MFYSYTGGEHKNMLVRFFIYQKRGMGYAKVIHKKEKKS